MKITDLFCGEGLVARELIKFGEVTGYDTKDFSKIYPGKFVRGEWYLANLNDSDFIWASPPCQGYSRTKSLHKEIDYPKLCNDVLKKLINSGKPFVVENVPGSALNSTIKLCGCMFQLPIQRIRLFETNFSIRQPKHTNHSLRDMELFTIAGHNKGKLWQWKIAMGLSPNDNVSRKGVAQGVPLPYVRYIMTEYLLNNEGGNFTPNGVVELGLNGSANATPKVSPCEEKPIV